MQRSQFCWILMSASTECYSVPGSVPVTEGPGKTKQIKIFAIVDHSFIPVGKKDNMHTSEIYSQDGLGLATI